MLLAPRLSLPRIDEESFRQLLDKVESLIRIYYAGTISYGQLKASTTLLLFEALVSEFEGYDDSPIEWHHGMPLREYNFTVDEELKVSGATYYRIGSAWLKKSTKWAIHKGLAREVIYYAREDPPAQLAFSNSPLCGGHDV